MEARPVESFESRRSQLRKIIDRIGLIEGVAGTETIIVLRTVKEEIGIEL